MMRMITLSIQPLMNPAISPSVTPISTDTETENRPTVSDTPAPCPTRRITSRPMLSVPKGCSRLGGLNRAGRFWSRSGLY